MWSDRRDFLLWTRAVLLGIAIRMAVIVVLRYCTERSHAAVLNPMILIMGTL
jgi:hypothetical protein